MRIAFLTTDNREHHRRYDAPLPYFGPAVESLLEGFAGMPDLELHVITCTQRPMVAPEKLAPNIWFHLLHVPKIGWLRTGYQGCIRAGRKKLRELKPDLVHGDGTERDCALSAVLSGLPNVIRIHGNMNEVAKTLHSPVGSYLWLAARLERFTLPRAGGVICNSEYTESVVRSRCQRTWQVPNALRGAFFASFPYEQPAQRRPTILNVGAIGGRKRQRELLRLATELHGAGSDFELQFIGMADPRHPYAAAFLREIAEGEAKGFARYVGEKSVGELMYAMDAASALIHIPSEEAFGLVVAEALARNLKFFGTQLGGIQDIASRVKDAELFRLEDHAGLRTAIASWLAAGAPRPKNAAEEMKTRYHPDVIARRHLEIYQHSLGQLA